MSVFCHDCDKLLQIWWLKATQLYYFTVSEGERYRLAQLVSPRWVSRCQHQGVVQSGSSWEILGRIHFQGCACCQQSPVPCGCRTEVPVSSLAGRSHSQLLGAACIPQFVAPFCIPTSEGSLSLSLQISPTSPSMSTEAQRG